MGPDRAPALPHLRPADQRPVGRADHRPGDGAARGDPVHGAGSDRAGPEGRVRQAARGAAGGGLHPGQDRRRAAPARRGDWARQEVQARHRDRGRPPGHEGRAAQAAGRLDRDSGRAGRRAGRDRARGSSGSRLARPRQPDPDVLGEVRLSGAWTEPGRARAAHLQLQLAAWGVPALHRPRVPDGDRSGAGRAGSDAVDRRGRDRAVGGQRLGLLRPADPGHRGALRRRPRNTVGGSARPGAGLLPVRDERRPRAGHVSQPVRPPALVRHQLRRDHPEPPAALSRDRVGAGAREDRGVHDAAPLPGLQGRPAAARVARRARQRDRHPRLHGAVGLASAGMGGRARAFRARHADLAPGAAGNRGAAAIPGQRRRRVSLDEPCGGHAVRWRGAADPAGHPDRLVVGGRALHPGRAVDRAAPARQQSADRHAGAASRPRQHRAGGRTRRGHDAGGRSPGRHGPGRRRARRLRRGAGHGRGGGARSRSR